jgi:hypothetical protein
MPGVIPGGMGDIAFSLGTGDLYGVALTAGGSFWSINRNNAQAQQLTTTYSGIDIPSAINQVGRFFDWTWNGTTLTGSQVGSYHDADAEAGFGGTTTFLSSGDIWVDPNGDVYATVNRSGFTGGWLVRVDPTTAEVDHLWTFTGAGSETHYGLARSGGMLYVLRDFDGAFFAWNGSTMLNTGQVSPQGVAGATATDIIPEPAGLTLIAAVSVVGLVVRRRRSLGRRRCSSC